MLKTVTIDSSTIGKGAFHSCPSLETVNLTNIDVVGDNAFANCFSLINLNIGQGVGIISAEAFSNCTMLETVVFNSSVTSIGEFCFSDCKSLKNVQFGANLSNIGEACFRNCTSIETIHITSSIANINAYAFEGCTGLKSFTVSDANSRYEAVEGHLVDERKCLVVFAFGNITDGVATIPNGVVSLGTFLFRNVKDLKSVVFPSSLKEIGNEAFYNSGIESINLNGIEIIGEYALGKCLSLKDVTIPKTVTTIKDYAFQDSIYLENVYIRSSVVNVGTAIFHVTDTLKEQLQLIEVPEIMVYIEHTVLPDTWVEAWSKGSNIIEIMGHYFND